MFAQQRPRAKALRSRTLFAGLPFDFAQNKKAHASTLGETFRATGESKLTGCAPECYHSCLVLQGDVQGARCVLVSCSRLPQQAVAGSPFKDCPLKVSRRMD